MKANDTTAATKKACSQQPLH